MPTSYRLSNHQAFLIKEPDVAALPEQPSDQSVDEAFTPPPVPAPVMEHPPTCSKYCAECVGEGLVSRLINGPRGYEIDELPCPACDSTGFTKDHCRVRNGSTPKTPRTHVWIYPSVSEARCLACGISALTIRQIPTPLT